MPSVLIIDDEWTVRAFLREALTGAGWDVREAANGKEGLDCYKQAPTDLIITDLFMGEDHGLEMILRLTQEFPKAKVIAISGGGEFEDPDYFLKIARGVGAKEVLPKPVGVEALLKTADKVLASHL